MNSDSFFESEFFHEHKGLITVLTTVSLAFFTIFWLYKGLKSNSDRSINQQNNQSVNANLVNDLNALNTLNNLKKIVKRRITINTQGILYKDLNEIDISFIYQMLDPLSKQYDLYLIVLVKDNEDTDKIVEKFSVLYEDGLIFKHRILFTTKLEGACAMIRSIDPFAHIESNTFIITNLLRFLNEFWFINVDKENLEDKIKSDPKLNNNFPTLLNKVKIWDNFEALVEIINSRISK